MSTAAREHYAALFSDMEGKYGPVSDITRTGIIGFSAGGPVSICQVGAGNHFVTCELSLYPEQKLSSQSLRYEFLSCVNLPVEVLHKLLTALGNFSMDAKLGHSHTIDVSAVMPPNTASTVRLLLCHSAKSAAPNMVYMRFGLRIDMCVQRFAEWSGKSLYSPAPLARYSAIALFLCAYGQSTAAAQTAPPDPAITSVALHRSACFGQCSVYTVEVRSDGEVRYIGEEHVKMKGHHTAHISPDEFNFLVASIERAGFFALNERYRYEKDGCPSVWTDHPSVDIIVTRAGQKKHVSYYYGCKGLEIYQRIIWLSETIDDVANSVHWVGAEAG